MTWQDAQRAATEASRHFRNAWHIRHEIGENPHHSLEHYRTVMALRHALQAGFDYAQRAAFHVTEEAGRNADEVLSEATRRDLAETESFRHWVVSAPNSVTLSRVIRAAEAAVRLADSLYADIARARALSILDRAPDLPPGSGDEMPE